MRTFLLALLLSIPGVAIGASNPARWIAPPGDVPCPVNTFTYMRKVVRLERLDGDLTLQVAADSNAHVWLNGHVVRRKVTRYFEDRITTESIDARPWLHVGANTVVVLLHSWGPIVTFQRDGCLHAGLYVSSKWVVSDSTWKAQPAAEYLPNTRQIFGLPGQRGAHRIRYAQFMDGTKTFDAALFQPTYDDSGWQAAKAVEGGPWPDAPLSSGTPGQHEEPVEPVTLLAEGRSSEQHIRAVEPVAIEKEMLRATLTPDGAQAVALPHEIEVRGEAGETRYLTVDFGRPVHGFPFLNVSAKGTQPTIDYAYEELARSPLNGEALVKPDGWLNPEAIVGEGYIDRYTTRLGSQYVELPDERTARWWTIHVYFPERGSVRISRLGFISSQYPVEVKGSFHASDPRMAQVVTLSLEHAIVSMSDTYVDTPGREDGQWLEDARLRAQLASQWFGDVSLRQLFLRLVAESQRPDGTFHPFPPSNYPMISNADWAAEWVGSLYDDYLWTGETTRINAYWPQVVAFWKHVLVSVSGNGLWIEDNVFADIRVGVHPDAGQSSGTVTAQLIDRLALSIEMARASSHPDQAEEWQQIHDRMLAAFVTQHLVKKTTDVPTHIDDVADPKTGHQYGYSQAAQAMTVSAGLLPSNQARADLEYAFQSPDGTPPAGVDRWNNPTYLFRALDALSSVGMTAEAVQHLFERFSQYLPESCANPTPPVLQGLLGGPLPEYWISREDLHLTDGTPAPTQPIDASGSHGWNSVGLVWLHTRMLGVTLASPGGAMLQISPNAGGLQHIDGTTITPHGPVTVSWTPASGKLDLQIPQGVRAHVILPDTLLSADRSGYLLYPKECTRNANASYQCAGTSLHFAERGVTAVERN